MTDTPTTPFKPEDVLWQGPVHNPRGEVVWQSAFVKDEGGYSGVIQYCCAGGCWAYYGVANWDTAELLRQLRASQERVKRLEPAVREALAQAQAEWGSYPRHLPSPVTYYQEALDTYPPIG